MRNPVVYGAYDMLMICLWHLRIMFSGQHIKNIQKKSVISAQHFQTDTWSMLSTFLDDTSDINDICQACPLILPGRNTWYAASQQIVSKRSGQSQDVSRICSVFAKSIMNHCWNTLAGYLWISMDTYGYLWILMDISMDIYGYLLSTDFGSMVPLASCRWLCMAPCSHRLPEAGWTEPPMHPDRRKTDTLW